MTAPVERRRRQNVQRVTDVQLRRYRSVLAVVAHPDDESFGLGAVLAALSENGVETSILCFTHGEASTLHGVDGDLRAVRAWEFAEAAAVLGVGRPLLLGHPDGALTGVPVAELVARVDSMAADVAADALLVFDEGGVTGHPDHRRATETALATAAARDLGVVAWALPATVAERLRHLSVPRYAGPGPAA